MTLATPDAPAPDAAGDVAASRRRRVIAVVAVLLVVVGAVVVRLTFFGGGSESTACTVVADGRDVRPPAAVTDAAARVRERATEAAATVTATCSLVPPADPSSAKDPADDPAQWVVGVDAEAADIDAVAAAADAVLAAAAPEEPFGWHLEVHDTERTLAVVVTPGGDTALVDDAVALRRVPGVVEVWFGIDDGRVSVATADDVAPLLAATLGRHLPVTTVEARDDWFEVQQVQTGTWPDGDAVALAAEVARWEGVWRVVLRGGEPASPDLTVEADDDARRAEVASRLAGTARTGPPVAYHVLAQQVARDGVLGGPVPEPAADPPADLAGVAACRGDELRVEVAGVDAALGQRYLGLLATHTGAAPCVLSGIPELAFTRRSGTPTPDVTQLPDLVAPDVPPAILLQPGGVAGAQVRWGAMSTSQDPDVAVRVTVRAIADGPVVDLVLTDPLDVLAGATVKVGPWRTSDDAG
ncbi:DUF4232 domain-containing protein [Cellulomonas sp. URHE0023]|uniref:DUF4232 domain-containing protein n=1 Tax=Cellulomonas sp. URHE0023 TaxID=1380354 RepID=UPI000485FC90|nr:DUF4232 domain-containing protein [Cellulomonas sp. URHE0023]